MHFKTTPTFERQAKKLAKKYPRIKHDLISFTNHFIQLHPTATQIKKVLYKIRIQNSDKNRGKRAGYRVYYYLHHEETIYLLTIYDKAQIEAIDENWLDQLIQEEVGE